MIAFAVQYNSQHMNAPPPKPLTVLEHFMLGFPGSDLSPELAGMLAQGLAGVALYPRNFHDVRELNRLTRAIRQAAGRPLLIGIDQEGGTKFSLGEPFTRWPSPVELGRLGDLTAVEKMACAMARELRAAGVNLNFAPMLDLATNPNSPVTAGRSFGSDPHQVAQMACAFMRGLHAGGVLTCAKHFPGHGDASVDPHLQLPRFDGTRERLISQELVPFAAAIDAGVPVVMTAHILMPAIDAAAPASLSRELLQALLRKNLHFDGIILADDLGMGAISKHYHAGESAVASLNAGTDILMLCHDCADVQPSIDAVTQALTINEIEPRLFAESHNRIERLRHLLDGIEATAAPSLEMIGSAEHRALADKLRSRIDNLEQTHGPT